MWATSEGQSNAQSNVQSPIQSPTQSTDPVNRPSGKVDELPLTREISVGELTTITHSIIIEYMIRSFRDQGTEDVFDGVDIVSA